MTQEEKDLLKMAICEMLPYVVKGKMETTDGNGKEIKDDGVINSVFINEHGKAYICIEDMEYELDDVRPYLRHMSSMTKEEIEELRELCGGIVWTKDILHDKVLNIYYRHDALDWLLKHHFDTRGLIEMGLALEAPEEMYKEE